ncbi:hypothetical protein A3742_00200 [Oleiphilus sp. HI0071]|nr:hypothetical protein A3737_34425 [Oleiphilus sp. HI0065]KZY89192.1 hypothetical protein A3744_06475 [Oleiphilus sp. HI0073]KZY90350.1 hypothetical protein A3742_00200 [Oleiphilus sp. HI0071]KZZ14077.1 hypothetical protein A3751_18735 [Oleiphilus sp. HI0080]KZZ15521.1 hypothetical protein A3750_11425 [Oleiphilus sp. HI0079]KZZ46831.1 hypothetical protein A3758_35970 [Oleiphilus sp. HI0118]KZZ58891.1 hypothetical protein A3760_06740 [Oleiphilus sp. HI0122]KZZ68253.1 hypothetical protein A37
MRYAPISSADSFITEGVCLLQVKCRGVAAMKKVLGVALFELEGSTEEASFGALKEYFEAMYFAN